VLPEQRQPVRQPELRPGAYHLRGNANLAGEITADANGLFPFEISSSAMPDSSTSSISFLILRISISILFLLYLISDYQAARN
jgi:hypothetical protein